MGYLNDILKYKSVVIQCHNNPDADAVASAFGVYCYLKDNGVSVQIVYGGAEPIKKYRLKELIRECNVPIEYAGEWDKEHFLETELLLTVDCQYGLKNVQEFAANEVAIIDHHIPVVVNDNPLYVINSTYQSCSTIIYEMLMAEGYKVKENKALASVLLFGLYTDTSSFQDLYNEADMVMKRDLHTRNPLLERLSKANMTVAELLVTGDAIYNHYLDYERQYILVPALKCEPTMLAIIGDLTIQVDICMLSCTYTTTQAGYAFSIRCCHDQWKANELAAMIADGVGSGGGHEKKAAGQMSMEKYKLVYGNMEIEDMLNNKICTYIDGKNAFRRTDTSGK